MSTAALRDLSTQLLTLHGVLHIEYASVSQCSGCKQIAWPKQQPDPLQAGDPALQNLLETHCYYCQQHSIRMDPVKFQEVLMLPLPLLDDTKEHYCPFSELYGDQPSENDRPSLQPSGDPDALDADAKHKPLFTSSKVWSILHCQDCLKPRCVYAVRKLGLNDKVLVDTINEVKTYLHLWLRYDFYMYSSSQ